MLDADTALISSRHDLATPPMKRHGRSYSDEVETSFLIQYGDGLPYRTCGIAQPRHPGECRLSSLEVLALLLLAIECYENAPKEPYHTVMTTHRPQNPCTRLTAYRYVCSRLTHFRCED